MWGIRGCLPKLNFKVTVWEQEVHSVWDSWSTSQMRHSRSFSAKSNLCLDASLGRKGTVRSAVLLVWPCPSSQVGGGWGPPGAEEFPRQPLEQAFTIYSLAQELWGNLSMLALGWRERSGPWKTELFSALSHIPVWPNKTSDLTARSSSLIPRPVDYLLGRFSWAHGKSRGNVLPTGKCRPQWLSTSLQVFKAAVY